jgi:acetyl-CoA carboxylase carboxyl transferase subunit alpha
MLGCVDDVVREPEGGTHMDPAFAMQLVNEHLERQFNEIRALSVDELLAARYAKFRNIAQFYTTA